MCQDVWMLQQHRSNLLTCFLEQYFSSVHHSIKRDEFRSLIQGNMSVIEYEAKFESLSHFDKSLDSDHEEKIKLFLKGLKPSIRDKVYHLNHNSVADAVKMALKVEQERVDASRFLDKKRGGDGKKSSNPGKKYKSDSWSSSASSGKSWFPG